MLVWVVRAYSDIGRTFARQKSINAHTVQQQQQQNDSRPSADFIRSMEVHAHLMDSFQQRQADRFRLAGQRAANWPSRLSELSGLQLHHRLSCSSGFGSIRQCCLCCRCCRN